MADADLDQLAGDDASLGEASTKRSAQDETTPRGLIAFDRSFTDDDHFFHRDYLTETRADEDTTEILGLLELGLPARILDAGCGDGRIAVRLASLGYDVVGVDLSPAQLDRARLRARARGVAVRFVASAIEMLSVPATFDAALLWFNTFGFSDDETNTAVLRALGQAVVPDGRLVIDTLQRAAIERDIREHPEPVEIDVDGQRQIDASSFDAATGRLVTTRTVLRSGARSTRTLRVAVADPATWTAWLAAAGFEVISITGHGGAVLDDDEWAMVISATRR